MRLYSRDRTHVGVLLALGLALAIHTGAGAQVGQNINVITGSDSQFTGDMFRQRQNESVGGISSVNTSHMMVAYNDYRTVDFLEDAGAVVPPSLINATFQKLLRFLSWPVRMARGRTDGDPAKKVKAPTAKPRRRRTSACRSATTPARTGTPDCTPDSVRCHPRPAPRAGTSRRCCALTRRRATR